MDVARIDAILDRWNRDPDYLIEILQDLQDEARHIPEPAMRYAADALRVPLARVFHAATFFREFSLEPRGRTRLQVCMGTACHVKGSRRILEAFGRELGVQPGGTTPDQAFTLEQVRCIGCCGLAPVMAAGRDIYGELSAASAARLVRRFRKGGPDA